MPSPATTYPDWKAPAEDGQPLIWPDPPDLLARTRDNQTHLASADSPKLQGIPLAELRRRQRAWIGHTDDHAPIIASGHQAELYHPGVWVKDVLANQIAARVRGQPYHFAVDTDSPKHLNVRWPGYSQPLTDDPSLTSAHWAGLLDPPTPQHIAALDADLRHASASWGFAPMLGDFYDSLRRLSLDQPNLPVALTNATHALDWRLGLRHHALVASPLFASEPYLVFAHHLLARAPATAADYNAALAEYRHEHRIRARMRPMPDLAVLHGSVEAPFWLDDLSTGQRTRPSVFATDAGWILKLATGAEFLFTERAPGWDGADRLGRWLRQHDVRLSPRALLLTCFLRLLIADQFIHGIGGGRYDQVTDRFIARRFRLDPPSFAVTTATLYFPHAVGRTRLCMPCIAHQGHQLRHNVLGPRKRQLLAAIDSAPRYSHARREAFHRMHHELHAARQSHPAIQRWQEQFRHAQHSDAQAAFLFDRELFYALQPPDRLHTLLDRYHQLLA